MKTLINIIAAAVIVAAAAGLEAQRPSIFGTPVMDRSSAIEMRDGVDPTLLKAAQPDAEGNYNFDLPGLTLTQDGLVVVEVTSKNAIELKAVANLPGIETLASNGHVVRLALHPADLHLLTDNFGDLNIAAYRPPVANSYGSAVTEGVELMRAQIYHASGLTGRGARIAVIDVGFGGLDTYLNEEVGLIERMPEQGDMDDDADSHGIAMLEVIRDYAPHADLLAIRLDVHMDIVTATRHAIAWGAQVIVCPLSWFELPGRGLASAAAGMADDAGILWVNAAGNFADGRYWDGQPVDTRSMGGHKFANFAPDDPYQFVMNPRLRGDMITLHFAYEQGGAEAALEVYGWDGMSISLVLAAQGNPTQSHQVLQLEALAGHYYFPMVRIVGDGPIGRMRMFSIEHTLHFNTPAGSIANPVGPGVISVGAVDAGGFDSSAVLEDYSSRAGGVFNLTLDFCGPVNSTTETYGPQGFSGTSAAAAHVAGLLALQMADPALSQHPLKFLDVVKAGDLNLPMAFVDRYEIDNQPRLAHHLIGGAYDRTISPSGDEDWFVFNLEQATIVQIRANGNVVYLLQSDHAEYYRAQDEYILQAGYYHIRVTGATKGEIAAYSLELIEVAPVIEVVTGLSPADGAAFNSPEVQLAWNAAKGHGSIRYIVEVARDAEFAKPVMHIDTAATSAKVLLDVGQAYHWRVTAVSQFLTAEASVAHKMTIGSPAVDALPVLLSEVSHETTRQKTMVAGVSDANETKTRGTAGCAAEGTSHNIGLLLLALLAAAALTARKARRKERTA